jgi:hypothetical protein
VPLLPLLPLESPVLESVVLLELDLGRLLKSFKKEGAIIYPNARKYNQVAIGPELNIGNRYVRLKAKRMRKVFGVASLCCELMYTRGYSFVEVQVQAHGYASCEMREWSAKVQCKLGRSVYF